MAFRHRFKKQFGQNFLRSDRFAHKLLEAAEINEHDHVVEIGPGDGRVTNLLLQTAAKVVAIEVDYDLIVSLIKRFNEYPSFEIVHQDILKVDFTNLHQEYGLNNNFKVVGSLPYNISKQIIAKMFTLPNIPTKMAFILQEEVTDAYAASAPQATFLSNWLRLQAEVKKTIAISRKQFYPEPKVNGGILQVTPYQPSQFNKEELESLSKLIRIGFSSPRKTLMNNLKASNLYSTEQLINLDEVLELGKKRPAELDTATWVKVVTLLNKS